LLVILRRESDLKLFSDAWFVSFAITILVAMNAGAFVLCFRRKKFICLFILCELASLILFFHQVYILVDEAPLIIKGSYRTVALVCIGMQLGRVLLFIIELLIIVFRLKY